jgi:autoinducer 2-degrading protein
MAKVTFISRMTCKPDKQREFTALCRELVDYVRKQEKGVLIFEFYRMREANRYAVLESFADEAAEHAHMNSKMLAEVAPKMAACLDGTWVREYFDELE